jgi:hypothetical protein
MTDVNLPKDLVELEADLNALFVTEPPRGLRDRVLLATGKNRAALLATAEGSQESWWAFAVGLAACIAFWANLSFSALNHEIRFAGGAELSSIDRQTTSLLEIAPELTREDARRQAAMLSAGLHSSTPWMRSSGPNTYAD